VLQCFKHLITWHALFSVVNVNSVCVLPFICLSVSNPRNLTFISSCICSSVYIIQKEALFCWLDSNFNIVVLLKFKDRPLVMHHLLILSSSIKDLDWLICWWYTVKTSMGQEWSPAVLHFLLFPNLKKFHWIHYGISQLFASVL